MRFLALLGLLLVLPSAAAEGEGSAPESLPPQADENAGQAPGNATHGQGNTTCHGDGAKSCDGNFTPEPDLAYVVYVTIDIEDPSNTGISGTYAEEDEAGMTSTRTTSAGTITRLEVPDAFGCEPWFGVTPFGDPPYTFRPECLLSAPDQEA